MISTRTRPTKQLPEGTLFYGACALVFVCAGWYVARGSSPKLLEAAAAVLLVGAASAWPRVALCAAVAVMALPYTWAPQVPKLGYGFGILVGLFLLITAAPAIRGFRPQPLDWAVLVLAVLPAPIGYFQGDPVHLTLWFAPAITLPYFGFRAFFHGTDAGSVFPGAVVVAGVVTSVIGLWETLSGSNPVVSTVAPIYSGIGALTNWNVATRRDGLLRAMSTFGHPIAFGMFLLIPLAFAFNRPGRRYAVAAVVMLAAEVCTLSRGPWIGAFVMVILLAGWQAKRTVAVAVATVTAVLVFAPLQRLIIETGSGSTVAGHNALYRFGLIGQAAHYITFLGHPAAQLSSVVPQYVDLTSLLAYTALATGVVGVAALAAMAWFALGLVGRARRGGDGDASAAGAAVAGQFVGLLAVTLITSYQFFFWASLAFLAHVVRRDEDAPLTDG